MAASIGCWCCLDAAGLRPARRTRDVVARFLPSAELDHPPCDRVERFALRFLRRAPAFRGHAKAMVGLIDDVKRRARSPRHSTTDFSRSSSANASRDPDTNSIGTCTSREMLGALDPRLARRMQREAEECQPAHARQRRNRLRLRGHSPAVTTGRRRTAAGRARASRRGRPRLGPPHARSVGGSGRPLPFSMYGN